MPGKHGAGEAPLGKRCGENSGAKKMKPAAASARRVSLAYVAGI